MTHFDGPNPAFFILIAAVWLIVAVFSDVGSVSRHGALIISQVWVAGGFLCMSTKMPS